MMCDELEWIWKEVGMAYQGTVPVYVGKTGKPWKSFV
jgi:hypothetical protein